jgi:hypothetical protein
MTKEQLAQMKPDEIANSLTTTQLAVLGALSVAKHIAECRDEKFAHVFHNAWVGRMSDLGILKEFENE